MRYFHFTFIFAFLLLSCAHKPKTPPPVELPPEISFRYFSGTYIVIQARINGSAPRDFVLDTGAGINLISKSLCKEIKCREGGSFTGKRMSGQSVTVQMTDLATVNMGGLMVSGLSAGVFDMDALIPGASLGGILSLATFQSSPVTFDYAAMKIRFETAESLAKIRAAGAVIPVDIDRQGASLGILMPLILPNGEKITAEVDTGSQALILHERFMKKLGVSKSDPKVKVKRGKDETGYKYVRYFSKVKGRVHLPGAPQIKDEFPEVMFQKIIYDGLVGHYFLKQYQVTYNIPAAEMIFR